MTGWSAEYIAHQREMAERVDDFERRLDRDYCTPSRPSPSNQPGPTKAGPRLATPTMPPAEFAWMQQFRSAHTARFQQELLATLGSRPPGRRIRYLRVVLGWSQRTAATQLGISRRTLIRHEQGHHRTRWTRQELLFRLCELEKAYASEILAYVDRRCEPA